jgi:hypothetical protein
MLGWYQKVGGAFRLKEPADGARWLVGPTTWLWVRLGTLAIVTGVLTHAVWQRGRSARLAAALLCAVPVADLLAVNHDLNPTAPADVLRPPAWVAALEAGADARVYIGGLLPISTAGSKSFVDGPVQANVPGERPFAEAHAIMGSQFLMTPAPWRVREIVSQDLPELWPHEYRDVILRFTRRSFEERLRFLSRAGVRYCILPRVPPGGKLIQSLEPLFTGFDLYDCGPGAPRAFVAGKARVQPSLERQTDLLFDPGHDPTRVVLLDREAPAAAGSTGVPARSPGATIIGERTTELTLQADVGSGGGFLTLLDSFDPDWRVTVDGRPATLLRANVLFRAVRLAPGRHEVRFLYRPTAFFVGLAISLLSAVVIVVACVLELRIRRRSPANEVHT